MGLCGKDNINKRVVVGYMLNVCTCTRLSRPTDISRGVPAFFKCPYPGRICSVLYPDCIAFNS